MAILKVVCPTVLGLLELVGSVALRADEIPYDIESIEPYLSNRENIFIGVRIDGGLGVGEIVGVQSSVGAEPFPDNVLEELQAEDRARYPRHRVLVVKNLKGTLPETVELTPEISADLSMPLGEAVLVFADWESGGILFQFCEVAPLHLFPEALIQSGDVNGIIRQIRDDRLLCLREPIKGPPNEE